MTIYRVYVVRTVPEVLADALREPILNLPRKPGEYVEFHRPIDWPEDPHTLYPRVPEPMRDPIMRLPGVESVDVATCATESEAPPPALALKTPKLEAKMSGPEPPRPKGPRDMTEGKK
jgi:hypothetical protein